MPSKASASLLIRTDASTQIGTGHVMRCLALAQAWQDAGGQATFAMALDVPALTARLETEGIHIERLYVQAGSADDWEQTIRLAHDLGARCVVVDGYHFKSDYQKAIKDSGLDLLLVDDNGDADHYYADIVLNQNLHAHENLYFNREPYTRLLLGTRFALLRREFLKWRDWKREVPAVGRKVLVTLGGGDSDNVTIKAIRALQQVQVEGLEAVIVVGGNNPHHAQLQSAVKETSAPIRLESNVTNMPELMAWADMAVSGGGSTCWELLFMGLPFAILILAENQRPIAKNLGNSNLAINLGWHENATEQAIGQALEYLTRESETRKSFSERGREVVGGDGTERVLNMMRREA